MKTGTTSKPKLGWKTFVLSNGLPNCISDLSAKPTQFENTHLPSSKSPYPPKVTGTDAEPIFPIGFLSYHTYFLLQTKRGVLHNLVLTRPSDLLTVA